jgi:integrase/recombinase XerD
MSRKRGEQEAWERDGDPMGFGVLLRRYLTSLDVKGFSKHTVRARRTQLKHFARWCLDRGTARPADVTRTTVEAYQRWLFDGYRQRDGSSVGLAMQSHYLVGVRMFYRHLVQANLVLMNPTADLQLPKRAHHLPNVFSIADVETVLQQPDVKTAVGLRDRAMLETMYSSGLRRQELVGLSIYDVEWERGVAVVRKGKGNKERVVPVGERALAWIRKYVEDGRTELLRDVECQALFLSPRGGPVSAEMVTKLSHRYVCESGVGKRGSCHIFRHTMATLMLEGGADVRVIQEILGHASIASTQLYTQVSIRRLKEVHEATHPGAHIERRARPSTSPAAVDDPE